MSTTAAEKARLRGQLRAAQSAWTARQRRESDKALFHRFLDLEEVVHAGNLLVFSGMGAEPDTAELFHALWKRGKTVALPRCLPGHRMEARRIRPDCPLKRHPYGMLEPGEDCPLLKRDDLHVILVPGLCYDKLCYRLGQGGGYYDRYLEGFGGMTVGFCREEFLRDAVPREPHDRQVDMVLTEERTLRANSEKAGP